MTLSSQPSAAPQPPAEEQAAGSEVLYCANHPDTETYLRCNKCGKPICLKCAVLTEVGYRCKECIREQQNVFYTAMVTDNWIALVVAAAVTMVAWPIVGFLLVVTGFFGWIIAALIGSGAGAVLAQIIRNSVGRRRGRYIRYFALAGTIVGLLASAVLTALFFRGLFPVFSLQGLLFAVLAIVAAYQILR
ncbi:MAG: B-box zinc finger protein [Caldilineaceae bacterium]|nr:B-box zinc finger protein [Caldilineaceae bacterium]